MQTKTHTQPVNQDTRKHGHLHNPHTYIGWGIFHGTVRNGTEVV